MAEGLVLMVWSPRFPIGLVGVLALPHAQSAKLCLF